jgi:hypothetical protein
MTVEVKALRLTIDEYERFRAADAEKFVRWESKSITFRRLQNIGWR